MIKFNANPAESRRITSHYGFRIHPISKKKIFHYGIDIGPLKKIDEPIYAVSDGEIVASHFNKMRGYLVIIQHSGFATLSQHLKAMGPPIGKKVKAGEKIGMMGSSGSSTGIHLHFEVYEGDYSLKKNVDPEKLLLTDKQLEAQEAAYMVDKIVVELDGKNKEVHSILLDDSNYILIRDLSEVLDIAWDEKKKKIIIKSK
jgi:murein DD-endopeptidase MepM/ murein hydrolase activator NlpD